jgi:hypothetical protein
LPTNPVKIGAPKDFGEVEMEIVLKDSNIPINKGFIISSHKEMTGNGQKEIDFLKGLDKMIEDFIRNVC